MQVSVESTGALERRLKVQVPGKDIQDKVDSRLKEMSRQVRIKGFRPGKVPMSVVRQRYGKQVRQEVVGETLQESLQQAIREQDLRPATMPRLDTPPSEIDGGDLEFSALVEVYPEIDAIDVGALSFERPEASVADSDVDEMLDTLREQRKQWDAVERKAKSGDRVLLHYSAEADGVRVPAEGEQRLAIIVGETGFDELEKAVSKIEPGGQDDVTLSFPENFREAALAGKEAKVQLHVDTVSEATLPEVDEDFIRGFGVEDGSLDTLKGEIRGNLERELRQATATILKRRLIEALLASRPDLDVPEGLVRDEATGMAAQATRSQDRQPDPRVVEAFMDGARRRVRAGLLMGELAQQNQIRLDAGKVRESIETIANTYEQPAEVMQLYYGNPQLMQQVESSVMEDQVVDWVLENAKVTPKAMTFQEVIQVAAKPTGSE